MRLSSANSARLLKRATHVALALIICWGFIIVLAQIMPFWVDEWRLMYSLKFKTASQLFGPLYFTQQFPRIYLVLLKGFTSMFDYSYFTLRLPAYLTAICTILLGYRLMNRIYGAANQFRYLFLLIIVSSPPFLKYLVQIKQYEMEIFLSLVGIWQLLSLVDITKEAVLNKRSYLILCLSFLISPFFSYTYPIVIAPVFLIVFIQTVNLVRSTTPLANKKRAILLQWIPLAISIVSIATFYLIDVSQVMHDDSMHCFWQDKIMNGNNANAGRFLFSIWSFFGSAGSGLIFEIIFSFSGITALVYGLAKSRRIFSPYNIEELIAHYALLLILVVLILFIAGMLPLGEARLNAFTFPSIAILIVNMLQQLNLRKALKVSTLIGVILYLGLFGNVGSSIVNSFTNADYARTVRIYSATEDAIIYAQSNKLPILITPDVAYPYDILHDNPCLSPMDAASVLKTFPAYKEKEAVPVFSINDSEALNPYRLPSGISSAQVGDGMHYHIIRKPSSTLQ